MKKNDYRKLGINAIFNIIQQISAAIFPIITIPYISRVLDTDNYGKINFTNSVISYFILFAQLGVSTYGIREVAKVRDNKEICNQTISEIFSITFCTTLISYLLLGSLVLIVPKFRCYLVLFTVQSISIMFYTLGAEWINKGFEDYSFLTLRYILAQVISIILMFVFVKNKEDYIVYAFITVLSQAGAYTVNLFHIRKFANIKLTNHLNLKKHLRPLLVFFWGGLATTIYVHSDSTILGLVQNDSAVGIYNISAKIYLVTKQVVNAMILVSIPRLSKLREEGKKEDYDFLVNGIFEVVITIVFPIIVGMATLATPIIRVVAGDNYVDGALSLRILGVSLLFAVLGCFFVNCILIPHGNEQKVLIGSIVSATINIVLNVILLPKLSYTGAALTTLIAEIMMFSICLLLSKNSVSLRISLKTVVSTVISCFCILLICLLGIRCYNNDLISLLFSVIMSGIIYLTILVTSKNYLIKYINGILKKQ